MVLLATTPRAPSSLARLTVGLLALALACGDDSGKATETTGPTTGPTTETGTTATPGTGTTGQPVTTGSMTGGMTGGETDTGPAATGPTTEGPATGTSAGETTAGETTAGEATASETTAGETTGDPLAGECEQDSDCELYTDCCSCDVKPKDGPAPGCNLMECLVPVCETLDIDGSQPVCRFGRCTFSKISCNPLQVICNAPTPDCPPGQLPTVSEDQQCWTGQCAPVEACDWAPDCAACVDAEDPLVCVFKAQKGAYSVCEPKPIGCGDQAEIDCGCGAEICEASAPHVVCSDKNPGIVCECPNC